VTVRERTLNVRHTTTASQILTCILKIKQLCSLKMAAENNIISLYDNSKIKMKSMGDAEATHVSTLHGCKT